MIATNPLLKNRNPALLQKVQCKGNIALPQITTAIVHFCPPKQLCFKPRRLCPQPDQPRNQGCQGRPTKARFTCPIFRTVWKQKMCNPTNQTNGIMQANQGTRPEDGSIDNILRVAGSDSPLHNMAHAIGTARRSFIFGRHDFNFLFGAAPLTRHLSDQFQVDHVNFR